MRDNSTPPPLPVISEAMLYFEINIQRLTALYLDTFDNVAIRKRDPEGHNAGLHEN